MNHVAEAAGRRERKKRQTRARIQDAALELFAEHGFRPTTIAAIAERADVATRTVAVHFPAKEDLLFADDPFTPSSLGRRLALRTPGETTLDALRDWMVTTMRELDAETAAGSGDGAPIWRRRAIRLRLVVDDDDLSGRARAGYRDLEKLVAAGIGQDLDLAADALIPRLAATTTVAGLREIYATAEAKAAEGMTELIPLVDRVLDFARAGIAAQPTSTAADRTS
jgi:AcrR family transcriptional regulator